ncbi:hypothetical protein [Nevskia ramosa]|uniref:hypothetical protein n=1 Tax=Nevskia ramosa TaxID=64002 RepID=UPI002355623A|nr:hypothetical protein [Nevskia ramosa]
MSQNTISKPSTGTFRLPKAKTSTAPWRVKGDGVAYTTSQEIVESEAWQRNFSAARRIRLKTPIKR